MDEKYYPGLSVRKLADKSGDQEEDGSWPYAGHAFEGDPPAHFSVGMQFIGQAEVDGWVKRENRGVEHLGGGPPNDPWRVTHTFVTCDYITFMMADGDYRYKVVRNPGKYDGEVTWVYLLEADNG